MTSAAKTPTPTTTDTREMARVALLRLAEEARAWLPILSPTTDLRPIADRVLVMMIDEPTNDEVGGLTGGRKDDKSGLYVVEAHRRMWRALVLRVAPAAEDTLRVGDCIILGEHVGMRVPNDDLDLRLVKLHDVLAVFDPTAQGDDASDVVERAL